MNPVNERIMRLDSAPTAETPAGPVAQCLADFILANREPILVDWEAFARTCAPTMSISGLRDHANEMLTVIAADLKTSQTKAEKSEKSKGNAPADESGEKTAAEKHGGERADSGFTVEQMVSEYRALRASVIRLWTASKGKIEPADLHDLTRFNEAIDQALSESVTRFTQDTTASKDMFLAILGHDLRNPLSAVITSAEFMLDTSELKEPELTLVTRIVSSSRRMNRLVGDLLDFTRTRLGAGIPIVRTEISLKKVIHDVVDEIAAAHPSRSIDVTGDDPKTGCWDCARISQVLANLIGNALEYGSDRSPISIDLKGDEKEARIAIHNHGAAIAPAELKGIFNPMKRTETAGNSPSRGPSGNLGLGLYIAERIVNAHKGRIDLESSDAAGTTFTVHLPRSAPTAPAPV